MLGLADAYQALFSTLKGQRGSLHLNRQMGTLAKPENQPSTVSVAPIFKKKQWKWKSTRSVEEEEASPKRD